MMLEHPLTLISTEDEVNLLESGELVNGKKDEESFSLTEIKTGTQMPNCAHYILISNQYFVDQRFEKDGKTIRIAHALYVNENHDLAIARSSSSRANPGLRVAFKCLNV